MSVNDEEYQKEYDKAAAELDAAAQATTARGPDGKFAKVEPATVETPAAAEAVQPAATVEEPAKVEEPDALAELRARVEKAEKIAKDNQAWATRMAQEAAQLKREREQAAREAAKPAILDANPELADAIRFVANDPAPRQQEAEKHQAWQTAIEKVHPGIFEKSIDPDLEKAIRTRFDAIGPAVQDELEAIRVITEEKLAFNERQIGKRFAAEAAKQAKVSAMTVPGAGAGGGSARVPPDAALAEVERIKNMSDADFAREVKRVKGF
jgi:hypothetical protein